ncbi:MAG: non-heme iron oxygenase ferredoxin subunit [Candidatus Zixiibacteriota bacterium]|nr:MAG: non-heme iron oxygenase ferredoxin subunit [candidate division Zixibacteria bacterium]
MAEFIKVAAVEDIPVGSVKSVWAHGRRIAVCHTEDGFFAVADECSHDYSPISSGQLRNGEIVCPRHGARFDIRTGEAKAPPAVIGIDRFEIKIQDEHIFVSVD